MVGFVNNLGYLWGGVPSDEVDRKHLKRMINVPLLMRARSNEDHWIAFDKFETSLIIMILIYPFLMLVWITVMFLYRCDEGKSEYADFEAGNTTTWNYSRLFGSSRIPLECFFFVYPSGFVNRSWDSPSPYPERQDSVFDDEWVFFAKFYRKAPRKELNSLIHSTKRACVSLDLGGYDHWEALWMNWMCDECH